jgi:hypothetical protein
MSIDIEDNEIDPPESARRFSVDLLIVHPTLDPEEITAAMGLRAHSQHRVSDPRQTSSGLNLPGKYRGTRWRHSRRFEVDGQHFASRLTELVDDLTHRRAFFQEMIATGGSGELILQFLGDGYHGDTIARGTLTKLSGLGLDLGIECFAVPQRP